MKCFKTLDKYYKVTGNPEEDKLVFRQRVIECMPLAYNVRTIYQHHYNNRLLIVQLLIDRPSGPRGQLTQYGLEGHTVHITSKDKLQTPNNWYNARHIGLLNTWIRFHRAYSRARYETATT